MAYPTTNGYYQPDMQQQQQQPLPMQQQPLPMQQPQPQQQQPPPQQQPAAMQAPAGAGGKYIPPHLRNKGMAAAEGYPAAAPAPEQNQGGCDWRNNSNNHNGNYNHQQMMVYGGNQNGYAPANNSYGYGGSGMQKGGGKGGYGGGRDGGGADGGGAYRPPHGGGSNFVRDFMNDYDKAVSGDWGNTTVQLTGKEVGGPQTDLTDARVWGSGQIAQPFTTFNSCTFPKPIMASIHSLGFSAPTAIQAYCWPVSAEGRDLIGIAKTGSGKTLAFLLPPFVKFLNTRADHRGPYMLVMAPTRELACQIQEQAEKFGRRIGIQSVCVYGGAPRYNQQREIRQGRHLIVGTPGRLNDFLESGQLGLSLCSYLVLDEADRMLDMGFEPQIRTLIQAIPEGRQTMMFSATWPREVRRLAQDYLNNPVHIQIGSHEATVNKDITQQVLIVNGQREKQERLREILTNIAPTDRVIVFVNTKRMCEQLARDLWNDRISCCTIHGDREQRERDQALAAFKSGRAPVMAATDVAARGLDIKGVKLVINFDVASNSEDHIHRIGRTGRAGEQGTAITFIDHTEAKEGREVMKTMEKVGQPVPEDLRELAYSAGGGGGMRNGRYGGKGYGKGGKGGKGGKKGGGGGYRRDDGGFGGGGGYGGRRGGGDNNRW